MDRQHLLASGSSDRTIKLWSQSSTNLLLTLTGHLGSITGLCFLSPDRYLFSCSIDKTIKGWDLESNQIINQYQPITEVYTLGYLPHLNILVSGGKDHLIQIWDLRAKVSTQSLSGHKQSVTKLRTNPTLPQLISGSIDGTVCLWDLTAGKSTATLTEHKDSIRDLLISSNGETMCSVSGSTIKKYALPEGAYLKDMEVGNGEMGIIQSMAVNEAGILVCGGDRGSLGFWDWDSGSFLEKISSPAVPGALSNPVAIKSMTFDHSGKYLYTGESDHSIKLWAAKQTDEV
jgi:pleiotropic regulator 1